MSVSKDRIHDDKVNADFEPIQKMNDDNTPKIVNDKCVKIEAHLMDEKIKEEVVELKGADFHSKHQLKKALCENLSMEIGNEETETRLSMNASKHDFDDVVTQRCVDEDESKCQSGRELLVIHAKPQLYSENPKEKMQFVINNVMNCILVERTHEERRQHSIDKDKKPRRFKFKRDHEERSIERPNLTTKFPGARMKQKIDRLIEAIRRNFGEPFKEEKESERSKARTQVVKVRARTFNSKRKRAQEDGVNDRVSINQTKWSTADE